MRPRVSDSGSWPPPRVTEASWTRERSTGLSASAITGCEVGRIIVMRWSTPRSTAPRSCALRRNDARSPSEMPASSASSVTGTAAAAMPATTRWPNAVSSAEIRAFSSRRCAVPASSSPTPARRASERRSPRTWDCSAVRRVVPAFSAASAIAS